MNDDGLNPARGLCLAYVLGGIIWILVFGGAAILIARCT